MFGRSFGLAILSGPLGGFGDLVMRLPPSAIGRLVLASPDYRAVQVKGVPHRGIDIAQSLKRRLEIRLSPRFPEARRGR
ncbi:MAG: hypothetical protein GDA36_04580 [Rhodobacteraceae bacterium]|nr:hypothetical protein [Paracoccaceae bacterium]